MMLNALYIITLADHYHSMEQSQLPGKHTREAACFGARPLIVLTISFTVYSQVPTYAWGGRSTNMTVQRAGIEPGINRSPVRRLTAAPYSSTKGRLEAPIGE